MTRIWRRGDGFDVGPLFPRNEPGYVHKFQRAVIHLNAIADEFGRYVAKDLHRPVGGKLQAQKNGWIEIWPSSPRPLPTALPIYLGDFLTNAKASLDYLVYDLVRANDHDPDTYTAFPICETTGKWDDDIVNRDPTRGSAPIFGVTEEVAGIIRANQPLRHRNDKARKHDPLMHLLRMCNADKHRSLHVSAVEHGEVLEVWVDPPGIGDITAFKATPEATLRAKKGNCPVARVKVRMLPGVSPQTNVYFGFSRSAYVKFSLPRNAYQARFDDLVQIVNAILRIGAELERFAGSDSTWFYDMRVALGWVPDSDKIPGPTP